LDDLDAGLRDRLQALEELLWSGAADVDFAATVPSGHLDALAKAGLYGIFAPVDEGGLGLGYDEVCAVVEDLATACTATTFVWVQHFRLLASVLDGTVDLAKDMRAAVIAGDTKGGVALTGLMPGPPRLTAVPAAGEGWALRGEAPWVSGWGIVDALVVVARAPDDTVLSVLLDARPQPHLTAFPCRLSALNATCTVRLEFDDLVVGADRVLGRETYSLTSGPSDRLRLNGSFALGVTKRCCLLIGPSPLDEQLVSCRRQLDEATDVSMPGARAAASALAVRAAHALAVVGGSRSALAGDVAERATREAALLLVFASRPAIRSALLERLRGPDLGS
jgi:alkylation response protein AidB-like acyl-CoA dehydrogenase